MRLRPEKSRVRGWMSFPQNQCGRIIRFAKSKDSERLIITPHIGWASVEARTRLMEIICQQIADFQNQIIL